MSTYVLIRAQHDALPISSSGDCAAKLKSGDVAQLQWCPVDGPKSRILKSLYGDTNQPIGSHHWTAPNRPVVVQATRVAAVRGRTVTLGDPLLHDEIGRASGRERVCQYV